MDHETSDLGRRVDKVTIVKYQKSNIKRRESGYKVKLIRYQNYEKESG